MVPKHIAIIPDGNRRYAKTHNLSQLACYTMALDQVEDTVSWLQSLGVYHLSAYAASGENVTNRSQLELIAVFEAVLRFCRKIAALPGVQLHLFGKVEDLPGWVPSRQELLGWNTYSESEAFTVHFGLNYSGLDDFSPEPPSALVPPVDLLVRTGGQQRLSGFLPKQTQYAELWFTDTLWPAFDRAEFTRALDWFSEQKRNFGS